jgi:hypothetical protein
MDEDPKPDEAPVPCPDPRLQGLIALRDELRALNARLEYVALMLRLAHPAQTK